MEDNIIDITELREKREPKTTFQKALDVVEKEGKDALKGVEALDAYFNEHPYRHAKDGQ